MCLESILYTWYQHNRWIGRTFGQGDLEGQRTKCITLLRCPGLLAPSQLLYQMLFPRFTITVRGIFAVLSLTSIALASSPLILLCTFHGTDDSGRQTHTSLLCHSLYVSLRDGPLGFGSLWGAGLQPKHLNIYAPSSRASKYMKQH